MKRISQEQQRIYRHIDYYPWELIPMKSTWFGDKRRHEFARVLSEADTAHNHYETFRCFLEAALYSFRQSTCMLFSGIQNEEIEAKVCDAQSRVKRPEKLGQALGVLTLALEEKAYDFLGTVMSELSMNNQKYVGQLFTPQHLSELIAGMVIGTLEPNERRLKIQEPACGGGSMVIAAANILKGNGFQPKDYWFRAIDVDWRCFAMTYIQLTLLGIPANVVCGNTLSLEVFDRATTLVGCLYPLRQEDEESETVSLKPTDSEETQPVFMPGKPLETKTGMGW